MPSVKWLQGVLLEDLKRTEFRNSNPELIVKDLGELRRVEFALRNSPIMKNESTDTKTLLRWRRDCTIALGTVRLLLKKMK